MATYESVPAAARGLPRLQWRWARAALIVLCARGLAASTLAAGDEPAQLVSRLGGPDALVDAAALETLAELGDASVPALKAHAASDAARPGRLESIELLGRIGTPAARDALLALLPDEKDMAVRGQVCIQLGQLREPRAIPIIARWMEGAGSRPLNDVPGGKEIQPSTCYIRHVEALAMIGDESGLPILDAFEKKLPKNVGVYGFVSNFVLASIRDARVEIADRSAFWRAVRRVKLEQAIVPLFEFIARDDLARLRCYDDQIVRHTDAGRRVLQRLGNHSNSAVADGARRLLAQCDNLAKTMETRP